MSRSEGLATHHYFDRECDMPAVKLLPGEYFVTGEPMVLTTVLGSCVSACVRDTVTGIGGMNHFMLPDEAGTDTSGRGVSAAMRYGAFAMEMLLNQLIKAGARRERLEAKVFGGGAVLAQMTHINIGERNAQFVLRYLEMEQVRVAAQDLCGDLPRRIAYFPRTGRVAVRKLRQVTECQAVQREEQSLAKRLSTPRSAGLELFAPTAAPPARPAPGGRPEWQL